MHQYGYAKAGIVIPPDFSSDLKSGKTAQVQLIVDGTDPTTAQTILSSAGGVVQSMSVEIIQETRGTSVPQSLDLRSRVWYNPDIIHGLSNVLPLTYFIKVLRGIILKGNGFGELYKEFAILVAFGVLFLSLATLKFKKKID